MKQEERKQTFIRILKDASCPEALAEKASEIASRHYPLELAGATEEEVSTVKQAQKYLEANNDD
jgi:hypothetical protein